MRDTFYTINYKGVYIHDCHDRSLKREIFTVQGKELNSLHSAKLHCSKLIKEHDRKMLIFVKN